MGTATLTISDEVKPELKRLSWINWSEVAKEEARLEKERLDDFEEFKRIVSKSKLTQKQADELSDEFKERLAKRYIRLLKGKK